MNILGSFTRFSTLHQSFWRIDFIRNDDNGSEQSSQQAVESLSPFLSISAEPHVFSTTKRPLVNISLGLYDTVFLLLLCLKHQPSTSEHNFKAGNNGIKEG
jgi:hypothetical protein